MQPFLAKARSGPCAAEGLGAAHGCSCSSVVPGMEPGTSHLQRECNHRGWSDSPLSLLLSNAGGKPVAFGKHRVGERHHRGEGDAGAAAFLAVPSCSISRLSPSFLFLFPPAANLHPETQRPPGRAILSAEGPFQQVPANLPLHAARDRPAAHHLTVGRRGAPPVPGTLHPAAAGPRAANGAQQRVGAGPPQQNHLRQ